jgi:hypothetical protein
MKYYEMVDKIDNLIQETTNRQIVCFSPSTVLGNRCVVENVLFSFTTLGTIYEILLFASWLRPMYQYYNMNF